MPRPRLFASTVTALLLLPLAACGGDKGTTAATSAAEKTTVAATTSGVESPDSSQPETTAAEQSQQQGQAPDPCKALTAEEVKKVLDLTYTVSGGSAGASAICTYKVSEPMNPLLSLSVNQLASGMTLDEFATTLASSLEGEPKKLTIPGANDARELQMGGAVPMQIIIAEKDGWLYQLQFGDVAKKFQTGKAAELMAEALN